MRDLTADTLIELAATETMHPIPTADIPRDAIDYDLVILQGSALFKAWWGDWIDDQFILRESSGERFIIDRYGCSVYTFSQPVRAVLDIKRISN